MSFLVELALSLFVEGAYEVVFIKKTPVWIRILLLILLVSFFGAILLGVTVLGISLLVRGKYLLGAFMVVVGIGLTYGSVRKFILDVRERKLFDL